MEIWDFNEDKNYTIVNNYKVLKFQDKVKAAELLEEIRIMIMNLFIQLQLEKRGNKHINLLLNTPFYLQEMQLPKDQGKIIFEGLNKPKEVMMTNLTPIGPDGRKRAKYRVIFLQLRNSSGKLKSLNSLKKLIAHELTHTALNHVTWREDDHGPEFNKMNKIILKGI